MYVLVIALIVFAAFLSVALVWALDKLHPPVEHPDVSKIQWPVDAQ
jgi:hypothetical protein